MMKEPNIELAKKRIWNQMKGKLPDRGTPAHWGTVTALRRAHGLVKASALKRVQSKERLFDLLPERTPFVFTASKRWWALGSLGLMLSTLLVPAMQMAPTVSAASENVLEPVSGDVSINGVLVTGTATLEEGDRVETGDGAMAHITFLDDSRVTMGPSTQVDILKTTVDPLNRAKTEIQLQENKGRVWTQVLNLVSKESLFQLNFPEGHVAVSQKASFDVQVSEAGTEVEVARSLVDVDVEGGGLAYEGVLGQGTRLTVGTAVTTDTVSEAAQKDVWWTFNLAYGKAYARTLDASYKQENIDRAMILPGNPLYGLKTFRENLQVSLALTSSARQDLLVEQAQNRLNEAQTLLARGDTAQASQVLDVYQETVEQVSGSDNETLLAQVDETQKQVLVTVGEDDQLLSVSQELQQVPDLIDAGDFEGALAVLSGYQDKSLSLLSELGAVPMDEREMVVSSLLDQKLSDLQLLRVLVAMPQLAGSTADSTLMEQLSMMVLSLREKELGELSAFFADHDYDAIAQQDMYDRLKDGADLTPEITEQFDTVESLDPRFSVPHADQAQDESNGGE